MSTTSHTLECPRADCKAERRAALSPRPAISLADLIRYMEANPTRFVWNFGYHNTCALRWLGDMLGAEIEALNSREASGILGVPLSVVRALFIMSNWSHHEEVGDITMDEWLAAGWAYLETGKVPFVRQQWEIYQ